MSATFYYQPVGGTYLSVGGAKDAFRVLLERLFDCPGPWELDPSHVATLRTATRIMENQNPEHYRALRTLVEAIELHGGTIRVWAEY